MALRRRSEHLSANEQEICSVLEELVKDGRIAIIGPIRQELLSGLRNPADFERLRQHLRAFDDEILTVEDFEEAARCHNACRSAGITGSSVNFLICATAIRRQVYLFTVDADFERYATQVPLMLLKSS